MMDEAAREKIQTEPLDLAELIAYGHRYFGDEILALLGITLVFALPSSLCLNLVDTTGLDLQHMNSLPGNPKIMTDLLLVMAYLLIWMVGLLVLPLFLTWAVWRMKETVETGEAPPGEGWRVARQRYMPLAWALLLEGLIVLGGLFLFVIPGIIWFIDYSFVIYIVSVLPMEGMATLGYSKKLARTSSTHWFALFGFALLFGILGQALPAFIAPENAVFKTLTDTFFELTAPYGLVILGLWFLNVHYVYQRAVAPPPA